MTRKRPTTGGTYNAEVTTPHAAGLMALLGSGAVHRSVALTRDEFKNIHRLYGFKPEGPNVKPPPPTRPVEGDYATGYQFREALQKYEAALRQHEKWGDPQIFMQAGADRNALRFAEADGLRLLAWLAAHVAPGEDPLKTLVQLAGDAGWDVDPEDVEWANQEDSDGNEADDA